jgi:hypothetical protein
MGRKLYSMSFYVNIKKLRVIGLIKFMKTKQFYEVNQFE